MRQTVKYYVFAFLLSFFASPLLLCIGIWVGFLLSSLTPVLGVIVVLAALVGIGGLWFCFVKKTELPDTTFKRLLPICLAFVYYVLVWVVSFGLNGYMYGYTPTFFILTLPFSPMLFLLMILRLYVGYLIAVVALYIVVIMAYMVYKRLSDSEVDIAFGVYPDAEALEYAEAQGVELNITPLALLPVVFIVHPDNHVTDLPFWQVQEIYDGEIKNWREVGGDDERIMVFAPYNNGSDFFGETLPKDLSTIVRMESKPGIYNFAEYHNYFFAIGYVYACGVYDDTVNVLAIDGVYPASENVRNGSYPYAEGIYAVTSNKSSELANDMINWLVGEQGQRFMNAYGYVGVI